MAGFDGRPNDNGSQRCDLQVSIPMLYEQLGFWEGDPSVLMALVRPPPPPPFVVAAPTMHPNLVSTLKSLIDVDSNAVSTRGAGRSENEEDIAIVPVDLIQNRRPFRCGHAGCSKTFKNPQTLRMHHKTHYSDEAVACRVENRDPQKGARAGHNKKIPSRCPVCRRTFVGLYELRRHFGRKHTEGEKMHACRKCGKRFYIEVDLRDHEKLCGEPIECRCGMKFAFKCNLVAHKKTHPDCQDPSSSDDCKTSSSNFSALNHTSELKISNFVGFAEMPGVHPPVGVKLEETEFSCVNQGVCG